MVPSNNVVAVCLARSPLRQDLLKRPVNMCRVSPGGAASTSVNRPCWDRTVGDRPVWYRPVLDRPVRDSPVWYRPRQSGTSQSGIIQSRKGKYSEG